MPVTGYDLGCFGYLAHAQVFHVTAYPPANSGAAATRIFPSLAGDAPITGLMARRLGLTACLVSNRVNCDPAGRDVLDALGAAGVRHWATYMPASGTRSPQVNIVADDAGTRTWFAWLGSAADQLASADLRPLNAARLAYIDCYQVIESAAITAISASQVPLILNLGGDPLTDSLAAAASGRHVAFIQTSLDEDHVEKAEQLAADLQSRMIADSVVITLGRHGAIARTGLAIYRVSAPTIIVRHTHGAGAAFSGGLAQAYLSGATVHEAVDAACQAGSAHCAAASHVPLPRTDNNSIKELRT
ncbi:MAG: carbohydrate kinase family protein [Pseudonocardiaceae bacterium]